MGVDEREARVRASVDKAFGRPVTYTPALGSAVSLVGVYSPISRFMVPELGGLETGMPKLEVQVSRLETAGVTPGPGDSVTFTLDGASRTYPVTRVGKPDHGWVALDLGARS